MGTKTNKKPLERSISNGQDWRRERDLNPFYSCTPIYSDVLRCTFFSSYNRFSTHSRHKKWHQIWHH